MPRKKNNTIRIFMTLLAAALFGISCFLLLRTASVINTPPKNEDTEKTLTGKRVLFISSYDETFVTVPLQKQGIKKVLDAQGAALDVEYMDRKNIRTQEGLQLFHERIAHMLTQKGPYDTVLLGDDDAMHFGINYQEELFAGVPLIFFCVNDEEEARKAANKKNVTGFVESHGLQATVEVASKILPMAVDVYTVIDDTPSGTGSRHQFEELSRTLPQFRYHILNSSQMTRAELGEKLAALPEESILLYQDCFEDSSGEVYTIPESTAFICDNASVPVFRSSFGGIGQGCLGGEIYDYDYSGQQAAQAACSVMQGQAVDDIPLSYENRLNYVFDYRVLKAHKLENALLPPDASIINKPENFFDRYGLVLVPFSLMLLAMGTLWLLSVRDYRMSNRYATALERSQADMVKAVRHDYLTSLWNRRTFDEELEKALLREKNLVLLLLDFDDFKEINDKYGHAAGNEVICVMATRITHLQKIYGTDLLMFSRYGGDEFALVLRGENAWQRMSVQRLQEFLTRKIRVNADLSVLVSLSFGAVAASPGQKADDLKHDAEEALRSAKGNGKGRLVTYSEQLAKEAKRRMQVMDALRGALSADGFYLLYQPQVDPVRKQVVGCEALLRMQAKDIKPFEFIPAAEESGMIVKIGRFVASEAVRQASAWREQGLDLPISINFSVRQMEDEDFADFLAAKLEEYKLPPSEITVEITESIFLERTEQAMHVLNKLNRMGVQLSLDDFGTGYSSLSYLTFLPLNEIKIDKSLTDAYLHKGHETLFADIARLIHGLQMKMVVEGVETVEQKNLAVACKCDIVQGYYYSRPLMPTDMPDFYWEGVKQL